MLFLKPNTDEDGAEDGYYCHPSDDSTTNSRSSVEMSFGSNDERTGSRTQGGRHHPEPAGTDATDTEIDTEPKKTVEYFVFDGG